MKNLLQVSFSPPSFILSPWQPSPIEHRSLYSCSFRFVTLLLSKAAAIAFVSSLFLIPLSLPAYAQWLKDTQVEALHSGEASPLNTGNVIGHNLGPLYRTPDQTCRYSTRPCWRPRPTSRGLKPIYKRAKRAAINVGRSSRCSQMIRRLWFQARR